LPVGVVNGQDSDAFRKRLEAAVKNGEISSEQAKVLLEVVKKTSKKDTKDTSPSRETMRAIREEIGAAIKAGKITEAQGKERWEAFLKSQRHESDSDKKHAHNLDAVRKELQAAVKAGKLTEKEAHAKMEAIKKNAAAREHQGSNDKRAQNLDAIRREIHAALKAGKITEKQAKAKMSEVMKRFSGEKHGDDRKHDSDNQRTQKIDAIRRELHAALKAGKITEEQAKAKMTEVIKHLSGEKYGDDRKHDSDKKHDADKQRGHKLEATWKELQAAVKAGKLTEEQAKAKITAIKKEAASKEHKVESDRVQPHQLDAVWKKLLSLVKEGKLTEKEAHAKMTQIKKGVSARGGDDKRKEEYRQFESRLQRAVEAGEISRDDAKQKLLEIRKRLSESKK